MKSPHNGLGIATSTTMELKLSKWVSSIFILSISLVILLGAWITQKPLCINSKVVQKLDMQTQNEVQSIFQCQKNIHVPYNQFIAENLNFINAEIQEVEMLFELLGGKQFPIQIKIFEDRENFYKIHNKANSKTHGSDIYLSKNLLFQKNILTKSLFRVWYQNNINSSLSSEKLTEEAITDLLTFITKSKFNYSEIKWPHSYMSVKSYCESDWKLNEHLQFCDKIDNSFDVGELSQFTELSLRPLFSLSLIGSYKNLSITQKMEFIKSLANLLAKKNWEENRFVLSSSVIQAHNVTERFVQYFKESLPQIEQQIRKLGYNPDQAKANRSMLNLDFVVYLDRSIDKNSKLFEQLLDESKKKKFTIGVLSQNLLYILPSRNPIAYDSETKLLTEKTVYISCSITPLKEIISLFENTQKILLVKSCNENDLSVKEYFSSIEDFALKNPTHAFAQINRPVFGKMHDKSFLDKDLFSTLSDKIVIKQIQSEFQWKRALWQEKTRTYKIQADYDVIDWYRGSAQSEINLDNEQSSVD